MVATLTNNLIASFNVLNVSDAIDGDVFYYNILIAMVFAIIFFIPLSILFNNGGRGVHDVFSTSFVGFSKNKNSQLKVIKKEPFIATALFSLILSSLAALANDYFYSNAIYKGTISKVFAQASNDKNPYHNKLTINPDNSLKYENYDFQVYSDKNKISSPNKNGSSLLDHIIQWSITTKTIDFPIQTRDGNEIPAGSLVAKFDIWVEREYFEDLDLHYQIVQEVVMQFDKKHRSVEWRIVNVYRAVIFGFTVVGSCQEYLVKLDEENGYYYLKRKRKERFDENWIWNNSTNIQNWR